MLSLGLIAAISYFIESVFGFGGTVLLLAFGAFHIDFKTLVYISIWASMLCSVFVLLTGWRHFSLGHISRIMLISIPGIILGTWLLGFAPGPMLLTIFAGLMVVYALQGLLLPSRKPPRWLGNALVATGGVVQGLYSTGGPFVVAGYRTRFANKSQLRSTMAAFFLLANALRVTQIWLEGDMAIFHVLEAYWLVLAGVPLGVWFGHYVHVRISEKYFRIGLLLMILLVSLFHISRTL